MSLFKKNLYLFILIQITSLAMTSLKARAYTELELQQLAIDFVSQQINTVNSPNSELSVTALPLDSRIKTRTCTSPLQVSSANPINNNRQSTLKIKCLDKNSWQIFVYTRQHQLVEVVTAAKGISKGQKITAQHLTTKKVARHLSRSNQFKSKQFLIGGRSKRNVRVGQSINYNYICNVCKGDKVTILANYKGMTVKTQGEALEDGRVGDNIAIRNVKSGKKIQAQVTNTQQVKVII
ncbi:flagellar basal body P-ring formation chaperone FlgA [Pseudoalteromonas sp.]|uniref:flagellar basal body P-ring formation chaperone FlgA n=1 Tax=Pseudoalteromonas sp. TaxID=53249 RepID=UPI0035644B6F